MNHDVVEVIQRPIEASRSKLVTQVTMVGSEVEPMPRFVMSKARRGSQGGLTMRPDSAPSVPH